ncbi:glycosyl hydrolase family protein [Trifolium repens]|nr:glycosyl hydrolase family protein [Trifolium repens]
MQIVIIWSLLILGFIFLLHLYSNNTSLNMIHPLHSSSHFHQLQNIEKEKFQIPPPNKKSLPQSKSITPLVDEFLDKDSTLRHVFFPHKTNAIDPMKAIGKGINDSYSYYYPGRVWLDTDGNPIQAHGGCILYDEISSTYYWYGEYKDGPTYLAHGNKGPARVDIIGVGCYSSKDLWTWKKEGIVLTAEETNKAHDLHKSNVLERPKVIYNEKTRKYVMFMHIDDANYAKASIGIAVSDTPIGPFKYLGSQRPHGYQSRDMTVFKDDDSVAYLIYSSEENNVMHIGPLTDDYLNVTSVMRRIFVGQRREAPAMFKHKGIYYMVTSGCTGWAPNEALVHASDSILGTWETIGNPCVGGNKMFRVSTFLAQSTFVVSLNKFPGLFIFMADRWNPNELRDSRYVWLPLIVDGNDDQTLEYGSRVSIYWHRKWKLPLGWNTLK